MRRHHRAGSTTLLLHRLGLSFIRLLATGRGSGSSVRIGSTADTAIGGRIITGVNRQRCFQHSSPCQGMVAACSRTTLATAFFRADLDQALGEKNEAGHLHPFGNDVADYLAPFALRIHPHEQKGPADSGDHDEYQKRMPIQ